MKTAMEIAGALPKNRRNGKGWVACCPAHADKHPSLSIDEGPDGKVFQDETKRLCDGPPPRREDLDCVEKKDWPTDQNGDTKDPWKLQNTLPMRDPETGQQYVFTTGSHGGISTIGKLSTDYGNYLSKHDDGFLPVIELGKSSYKHKSYGEVFIPVFHIVGWKSEAELMGGNAANDDTAEAVDDEIPF